MSDLLLTALERLPPRVRRLVVAVGALLALAAVMSALTLTAPAGDRPRPPARQRQASVRSLRGLAAPARAACLNHGDRSRTPGGGALPRRLSAVRVRPRQRTRDPGHHAGAAPAAARQAGAVDAGRAPSAPAGRVAADDRHDAGVRGRDSGHRRRRGGHVSPALHARSRGPAAGRSAASRRGELHCPSSRAGGASGSCWSSRLGSRCCSRAARRCSRS